MHFSIFFGFSVLLAVCTRNTVVCVFGSIVFWCVAWSMNFGRHAFIDVDRPGRRQRCARRCLSGLVDFGYWVLPKPADLGMLLYNSLGAGRPFRQAARLRRAGRRTASR